MARPPPNPMITLSPNKVLSSPPWYKRPAADSDTEDHHNEPEFDFLAGASTPLHVNYNKSIMFVSPMKRLDKLHLSPSYRDLALSMCLRRTTNEDDAGINHQDQEELEDEEDEDDYGAGDQTLHSESDDDDDSDDADPEADYADADDENASFGALDVPPSYIPQRKRRHTDSPLDMEITPMATNHTIPHGSSGKMTGILGNETCESILKISFSASDSTPCPSHPRKRLRFKKSDSEELTPSQSSKIKRPLLDFSSSRKLSANGVPLIYKLNDAQDDPEESARSLSGFSTTAMNVNSTPISQSTPANSRAPSPCILYEANEDNVNDFKFVKPSSNFSYRTPQARPSATYEASQRLINQYVADDYSQLPGRYEIVGEFRASAAGMMEDVDDLHVGDKRINDPYAMSSPSTQGDDDRLDLRHKYMVVSDKLPLLQHFKQNLTKQEMLAYINDNKSVSAFYDYIFTNEPKDDGLVFLKKERLRWHPDKWVAKYDRSIFDKDIVDSLSQVINSIIERF